MKKKYVKPSMEVFVLPEMQQLLVGSYPGEVYAPTIPGADEDLNKLA